VDAAPELAAGLAKDADHGVEVELLDDIARVSRSAMAQISPAWAAWFVAAPASAKWVHGSA
jgi:hypothetical protein